jgi:hypothetical protein
MGEQRQSKPNRRAVLTGIGVAGGVGLLGEAIATPASAAGRPGSSSVHATPASPPTGFKTISSPPQPNVSYQFRSFWDFTPADTFAAGRAWGGSGFYTPGSLDPLLATFDAPPGAVLHDIEWYVENTATAGWGVGLWGAGSGFAATIMSGSIAAGSGIVATKFSIPSSGNGPYPAGTRILAYITTSTDGSIQVNGVRLGFTHGALNPVMLASPVRVYNASTPLHGGTSRTISLSGHIPVGAQAVTLAVTVIATHGSGYLHVAPAGSTSVANAVTWARTGDRSTSTVVVDVPASRAVSVSSGGGSGTTNFIVDLIGWVV